MKKFLIKLMPCALISAAVLVASCTKVAEGESVEPVFPDSETFRIEPAGTVEISFTANLDWKLSIPADSDIFRILDGSQDVFSVRGPKGEASVTVKCIAKDKDFENHTVDLTLEMGGKRQVIASVYLPSDSRTISLTVADVDNGAFVPSPDGTFDWSYTGKPLEQSGNVNMLWDMSEMAYKAYVRVESNYDWKFSSSPEGVDIAGGKVSGIAKEYAFTVSVPDLESERIIPFALVSSDEQAVETPYNLVVPKHTPAFSAYKVIVKNGFFELPSDAEGGLSFEYEKTALEDNGSVQLVWPDDRVGFGFYLLVDANFSYDVYAPELIEVKKGSANRSRTEIELSASTLSKDAQTGKIVFRMKGTEFSKTFSVTVPACADVVKDDVPAVLEFNEEGKMKDMNGEFSIVDKAFNVTSAGKLQYFKFVKDGEYYKSEALSQQQGGQSCAWLKVSDTWVANDEVLQNYEFHITADVNSGAARNAMVIGVPSNMKVDDPDGQLLNQEGTDVADSMSGYLVIKASQFANPSVSGEPIVAVDPEYWPQSLSSFKLLTSEDNWEYSEVADYFEAEYYYKLTYGADVSKYPTVGEFSFLKFNRKYTGYRVYALSDRTNPVADKDKFWVTVNPSQYSDNEVSVQMTPEKCNDNPKDAFIVFYDSKGDFAAVYCSYDPDYDFSGGSATVSPEFVLPDAAAAEGSALSELTEENPLFGEWNPGNGSPVWLLTYTKESQTSSALTGLPQGMTVPNAEWLSIESSGSQATVTMDKSLVPEESWNSGKATSSIVFYDSSWSVALTLVCTLDLSASAR